MFIYMIYIKKYVFIYVYTYIYIHTFMYEYRERAFADVAVKRHALRGHGLRFGRALPV